MPENLTNEISKIKNELANCKRQLKDGLAFNERLRSSILLVFVNRKTDHINHEKPSTWAI